jgi:hypothetical protein
MSVQRIIKKRAANLGIQESGYKPKRFFFSGKLVQYFSRLLECTMNNTQHYNLFMRDAPDWPGGLIGSQAIHPDFLATKRPRVLPASHKIA